MKRYHTATIARLLERYMAGTTTLREERLLERYFQTATDIPAEWAVYQTMFTQYAQTAAPRPHRALRPTLRWVAAASVVVLCALAVWLWMPDTATDTARHTPSVAPMALPASTSAVPSTQVAVVPSAPSPSSDNSTPSPIHRCRPTVREATPAPSLSPLATDTYRQLMAEAMADYAAMAGTLARQADSLSIARQQQVFTILMASGVVNPIDLCADLAAGISPADLFIENI